MVASKDRCLATEVLHQGRPVHLATTPIWTGQ